MNLAATRLLRALVLLAVLAATAWIAARSPLPTVSAQGADAQSTPNRAGIVVRFDDGRVESRCISFEEPEIGADELLQRSGLADIVIAPAGTVCRIDGKGCPSDDCFCECPFPNCEYWAYYHRENGRWSYSSLGAANTIVTNGDLDGWSWGQGNFQSGIEPPQIEFEQVCPAVGTEATVTVTPTATATNPAANPMTPPQATFYAAASSVAPGQCTVLNWQTSGATSVILDGVSVSPQGSQEVCPAAAQTWILIAANWAGQTTQQVSVTVQQDATPPRAASTTAPTATATPSPTAVRPTSAPSEVQAPPVAAWRTPVPILTRPPQPLVPATVAPAFASPPTSVAADSDVLFAPTPEPLPVFAPTAQSTPTRFEFSLPPTETPRPRRVLDNDGPTPTPILLAHANSGASGGSGQASAASKGVAPGARTTEAQSVQSRSFSPSLLPGYAAYFATVGVLLIMGLYVFHRRREPVRVGQDE